MKTITAYKCVQCGHVMYPKHLRCLSCGAREFDQIEPQGKGKLLTYTVVNELPWGIDERGRILGVVEFENGVKALGLVFADKVKIGMKLNVGWEPVRVIGGQKTYGLSLRP
ncbi:Zn-ribbon domain-containing OB-fold protein [Chloroflexota bacterium]